MQITPFFKEVKNEIGLKLKDLDLLFEMEGKAYIKSFKCKEVDKCVENISNLKFTFKKGLITFRVNRKFLIKDFEKIVNALYEKSKDIFISTVRDDIDFIEIGLFLTGIKEEK